MDPFLVGGASLVMGALNLFGEQSEYDKRKKQIDEYIKALEDMKKTEPERMQQLDTSERFLNSSALNTLNNTSVGLAIGGVLNPENYKSKILGQLESKKTVVLADESARIDKYNEALDLKIAEAKGMVPEFNGLSSFVGGAAEGFRLGTSLDLMNQEQDYKNSILELLAKK